MTAAILAVLKAWGGKVVAWAVKPPGLYVAAALAVLLAVWGSGQLGYGRGERACEAAHKAAAIAETQRQVKVGATVVQRAEIHAVADAAKDKKNQEIVRHVVETVAAQPDAANLCVAADVADRLRDMR